MSKTALEAPRSNIFNIRHDNTDVLIRLIEDPAHPDYDPRVELPVDPELMESIRMVGMLEPAIGYKAEEVDGSQIIHLVVGRQRWKAIRAIWLDMQEKGQDMALAPAFKLDVHKGEDAGRRRQKRIIENRHRQELSGLALAKELATHLEIVGDDDQSREQARIVFNFKSLAAMDNCLALLDTTAKVQALVTDGTLSPTAALQLAHQPADVQDRVADRIEAEGADDLDESDSDDEGGVDPAQIDAFPSEASAPAPERSTTPRQIPVSGVKEMIREETGKQAFALVTLKQIEKQIEKKEADLDKALDKLENATDSVKVADLSARVAGIQEYIKALRWARGENGASTAAGAPSAGNDKMSAAWDALRDAIVSANWPRDAYWPCGVAHELLISGETVAWALPTNRGIYDQIIINANSKWFVRLMDPFGNPSRLIREWGAHCWIDKNGSHVKWLQGSLGRVAIRVSKAQIAKWIDGTSLAIPDSVEAIVLRIISEALDRNMTIPVESRLGSPWTDEDAIGPDLGDCAYHRGLITYKLRSVFNLGWIPDSDCAWSTVRELIGYVERKLSAPATEHEGAGDEEEREHSDRKCPHCGSSDVSPFVAGTADGTPTDSGMICDECDMSFDTADKDASE